MAELTKEQNKTIDYVAKELARKYNYTFEEAQLIVRSSIGFICCLTTMPDFVGHYTADVWAEDVYNDYVAQKIE